MASSALPQSRAATDVVDRAGTRAGVPWYVKTDGTVFAHTHPEGSAAMAAVMLADANMGGSSNTSGDMAGMATDMPMNAAPMSNVVEFPYGFPTPGRYRVFVQMKHGGTVETGVFDVMMN